MRNLILDLETIPSQNPAVKTAIYARDAFRLALAAVRPVESTTPTDGAALKADASNGTNAASGAVKSAQTMVEAGAAVAKTDVDAAATAASDRRQNGRRAPRRGAWLHQHRAG